MIESDMSTLAEAALRDPPRVALVLGSGLGDLAERLTDAVAVPFGGIPGLAAPTVAGHSGRLLLGGWAGRRVLLFAGRLHFYEGHPWRSVVEPIHLMRRLGAKIVLLTNAVGGIRGDLGPGSLVALRDHFDWTRPNCWKRPGPGEQPSPYSPRLLKVLDQAARGLGFSLPTGVYAQVTGPCYETPAEVRALRIRGADVVGMSTSREIRVACDLGLECAAISCVCNKAAGLADGPIHHAEVLDRAAEMRTRLTELIEAFLDAERP